MKRSLLLFAMTGCLPLAAEAFCGFYVAKADTKLFNRASQVVLVRDEDKTVMTMANDFEGDPKEFAVVIPVPTFLEKSQIHVGDKALIDHLDAYSAPRLVEYFDPDPCHPPYPVVTKAASAGGFADATKKDERAAALGVKVEATYTIGEYDILILSANESNGLETWLKENGYKIPDGAADVLNSYIKQKVRFFVAKVNLEEKAKAGFTYLRPIQVAFNSPKFMLPIRLGTVNANGTQELFIYTLTRKGRVETTNYRTVKLPTGMDIPLFVKEEFGDFYKALFDRAVKKEDMRCVFTEYAWDTSWCDPCASDPPSKEELKKLGVFWLDEGDGGPRKSRQFFPRGGQSDVFLTRLHVRYDRDHFPEDLVFQETGDRENFQGRYVLRHPWKGKADCEAGRRYEEELPARADKEAQTLSMLTGWDINNIRERMKLEGPAPKSGDKKWWEKLWK
ncbi:MAG TPA: DUF2330 domain-containing protein [Chthoniobacteraceae bacterium]|jgi:hypothetical protein|nr:DUF2330 domain-containing protein [Chthoniobacteraceae bacterium]